MFASTRHNKENIVRERRIDCWSLVRRISLSGLEVFNRSAILTITTVRTNNLV